MRMLVSCSSHSFVDSCTNDNGRRLLNLWGLNDLSIVDTWFIRKKIHQWYSPGGRTRKALDHIIVTRRWRSFVTNARVLTRRAVRQNGPPYVGRDLQIEIKTLLTSTEFTAS